MSALVPFNNQPSGDDAGEGSSQQQEQQQQQPQIGGGRPFLELPFDVRHNIYQHLLIADGPIQDLKFENPVPPRLHTGIMATCSEVRDESHKVLYRENIVQMEFCDFFAHYQRYFSEPCEHIYPPLDPEYRRRLQEIKCFEIIYEAVQYDDMDILDRQSRTACRMMSQLDDIRYVALNIAAVPAGIPWAVIMRAWSMLRNVGKFVLDTVGLDFDEHMPEALRKERDRPEQFVKRH